LSGITASGGLGLLLSAKTVYKTICIYLSVNIE